MLAGGGVNVPAAGRWWRVPLPPAARRASAVDRVTGVPSGRGGAIELGIMVLSLRVRPVAARCNAADA